MMLSKLNEWDDRKIVLQGYTDPAFALFEKYLFILIFLSEFLSTKISCFFLISNFTH